jgi:hypothetical protein
MADDYTGTFNLTASGQLGVVATGHAVVQGGPKATVQITPTAAKHQKSDGFYESDYAMTITDSYAVNRIVLEARGAGVVSVHAVPTGGGVMFGRLQEDTAAGAAIAFDRPGPSYTVTVISGPGDFTLNYKLT